MAENIPQAEAPAASPSFIKTAAEYTTLMVKEWINSLLYQPTTPPFSFNADFKDELGRVVRLIIAVLTISGAIVGTANLLSQNVSMANVSGAITILIAGLLLTLVYTPFFYLWGVRINHPEGTELPEGKTNSLNIGQIFYSILYTFVPWIPVSVFIRTTILNTESLLVTDFLLLAPIICLIYVAVSFARSIKLISNAKPWRIWLAILSPLVILVPYFVVV